MWTPRDQLQAYQYLRRRLVSAIQRGDANHPTAPSRRLVVAYALGATATLLAVAGFGIYGLVRPGASQNWKNPGQVVIEKETGAAFVLGADGSLHPMLNYASARLVAGGDGTATAIVSARSLASVPRGEPLGIAGAPDSLPAVSSLVTGGWTVCSVAPENLPAGDTAATTAAVGITVAGTDIPADRTLIAQDADAGDRYALIDGMRLKLANGGDVALGYDRATPVKVRASWLSAVPLGPNLEPIEIPGSGQVGPSIGGQATRVGQVLVVRGSAGDDRYYAVRDTGNGAGLVAVTQIEAELILGDRRNEPAYPGGRQEAIQVSASDLAGRVSNQAPAGGYPVRKPQPVDPLPGGAAVCATTDGSQRARLRVVDGPVLPAGAKAMSRRGTADARLADSVFVPPGRGAVVRERQSPGSAICTVYLLTDQGTRYPVGTGDALARLGYGRVKPTPVDSTILQLFPLGPTLDVASAQRVATQ